MTAVDKNTDLTCLAIETATAKSTVAARAGSKTVQTELSGTRPGAGEIYGAIEKVMKDAGVDTAVLNCIAFGCGPGGFTGVRIAAAVTQGLAFGLGIPVARVSTLALLAQPVCEHYPDAVAAVALDARQNEAYVGFYRLQDGIATAVTDDALVAPQGLEADFEQIVLAGPGWAEHPELSANFADRVVAEKASLLPEASSLFAFAERDLANGELVQAQDAQPNYLRDKVWD